MRDGVLHKPGEDSQATRQFRFTKVGEITKMKQVIKAYIAEAIELEKSGKKVAFKKELEPIPEEFQAKLDGDAKLNAAFAALTPGRQRGYIIHFSAAETIQNTHRPHRKMHPKKSSKAKGFNDR